MTAAPDPRSDMPEATSVVPAGPALPWLSRPYGGPGGLFPSVTAQSGMCRLPSPLEAHGSRQRTGELEPRRETAPAGNGRARAKRSGGAFKGRRFAASLLP